MDNPFRKEPSNLTSSSSSSSFGNNSNSNSNYDRNSNSNYDPNMFSERGRPRPGRPRPRKTPKGPPPPPRTPMTDDEGESLTDQQFLDSQRFFVLESLQPFNSFKSKRTGK